MARVVAAWIAVLMCAAVAQAQTGGGIDGQVTDATGAVVGGARVTVSRQGMATQTRTSDPAGHFRFETLSAGAYVVHVAMAGFADVSQQVDVAAVPVTIAITLPTPSVSESLVVTGDRPGIELNQPSQAASRLGLTLRETPAMVDIVTFAEAQERGLRTAIEALTTVPGVNAANLPSSPGITAMRGFTGGAISLLFDGTRISTSTMVGRNVDAWSFERIEVLKGPASVLYGEGALAGVVNLVPKRPSFGARQAEAFASFGSFDTVRVAAGASGPINERVAYRVDASFSDSSGYIDKAGPSTLALAGAVDVRLGQTATLSLAVDYFGDDYGTTYYGTPLVSREVARDPSDLVSDSRGLVIDKALRRSNFNVSDGVAEADATWTRGKFSWAFASGWRLDNDFYFYDATRTWKNAEAFTFSTTTNRLSRSSVAIAHDHRFYGNRTAVSNDVTIGGRRNRFTAGVEANRNDFFNPRRFGATTAVDPYAPEVGRFPAETPENFPGAGNFVDFDTDLNLVSAFAENAFNVAPRVLLVAGLHYDHLGVRRGARDYNLDTLSSFENSFDPVSWRVGGVVDALPKTQLFGQYSYAVAPASTILLISQNNLTFDLTTGDSWEGGVKTSFAGDRIDLTASTFRITQDDILTRDPNNANITIQGGTQRSTGVELSVAATVAPGLRLDVSTALMQAEFVTLLEAGGVSRAGNVPPNVPERTLNVWASYAFPTLPLTISSGVRRVGRYFLDNANSTSVAGAAMVDAAASYRVGQRATITVRGRNLTDTLWADWAGASANQVLLVAPRSADVSLSVRF